MRRLFAVAIVVGAAAACDRPASENQAGRAPVRIGSPERPPLPVAEPRLDRAALLGETAQAASAAALGVDDREGQRGLDGDRFELRIRFGCPGGGRPGSGSPFSVRFETDTRTLRLHAEPDLTREETWIAELGGESVEAVEGFWMYRPWLLSASCIPAVQSAEPAPDVSANVGAAESSPVQRVGIAQFFTSTDPRTRRRDNRAYDATMVLPENDAPSPVGYDLVLSGRLQSLADGRVIHCHLESAQRPPNCLISADIDRVWMERPGTKAILAEWSN